MERELSFSCTSKRFLVINKLRLFQETLHGPCIASQRYACFVILIGKDSMLNVVTQLCNGKMTWQDVKPLGLGLWITDATLAVCELQ